MKLTNSAKIGIGWAIVVTGGIYAFYLSRTSVERQRYEHMKVRERIRHANEGEYDPSTRKYAN